MVASTVECGFLPRELAEPFARGRSSPRHSFSRSGARWSRGRRRFAPSRRSRSGSSLATSVPRTPCRRRPSRAAGIGRAKAGCSRTASGSARPTMKGRVSVRRTAWRPQASPRRCETLSTFRRAVSAARVAARMPPRDGSHGPPTSHSTSAHTRPLSAPATPTMPGAVACWPRPLSMGSRRSAISSGPAQRPGRHASSGPTATYAFLPGSSFASSTRNKRPASDPNERRDGRLRAP